MAAKTIVGSLLTSAFLLSGCSSHPTAHVEKSDGYLSINRVAPPISASTTALGFGPMDQSRDGKWLSINTTDHTVSLMEGDSLVAAVKAEGQLSFRPGSYQLLHKQRSPLWYAGDNYFSKRGLPVPASGDRERYRRGALGDFALFLDKDTPLHSAQIWSDEVGGLRIPDLEIRKIYYSLDVGSRIEIK